MLGGVIRPISDLSTARPERWNINLKLFNKEVLEGGWIGAPEPRMNDCIVLLFRVVKFGVGRYPQNLCPWQI